MKMSQKKKILIACGLGVVFLLGVGSVSYAKNQKQKRQAVASKVEESKIVFEETLKTYKTTVVDCLLKKKNNMDELGKSFEKSANEVKKLDNMLKKDEVPKALKEDFLEFQREVDNYSTAWRECSNVWTEKIGEKTDNGKWGQHMDKALSDMNLTLGKMKGKI